MRKGLLASATSAVLLTMNFTGARAQTTPSGGDRTPRYEVGGQVFAFNGHDLGLGWGGGGRFTYNINEYVALDNEINFFLPYEGQPYATEGLFGIKAGKHG